MTEIAFHFNAPDKVAYACRLLRKAVSSDAKVVVTGDAATLGELDVALWTFGALEFLPHCRSSARVPVKELSPVFLTESATDTPHQQVLVNLGGGIPAGFERYERLIEVVTLDDDDRGQARGRWKHYADRGYEIKRHDLNLKTSN